ncbi:hypothetical protein [Paraglaciecola sp.]|uniref:hypothetical protein n=1 Tax=Paraglaciecola sp. TaxID=1920173 RepID=UPI0032634586
MNWHSLIKECEKLIGEKDQTKAISKLEGYLLEHLDTSWPYHLLAKTYFDDSQYWSCAETLRRSSLFIDCHLEKNNYLECMANLALDVLVHFSDKPNCFEPTKLINHIYESFYLYVSALENNGNANHRLKLQKKRFGVFFKVPIKLQKQLKSKSRIAILMSGQIRGVELVSEKLEKMSKHIDFDIFLDVWNKKGIRLPTLLPASFAHLSRSFKGETIANMHKAKLNITSITEESPSFKQFIFKDVVKGELTEAYKTGNIRVWDENEFLLENREKIDLLCKLNSESMSHASPSNMAKMVYLNFKNFEQFQTSSKNNSFEYILKTRPDIVLNLTEEKIASWIDDIESQNCDLFIDYHGALPMSGDQFAFGKVETIKLYCNLWNFWDQPSKPRVQTHSLSKPHQRLTDYLSEMNLQVKTLNKVKQSFDTSYFISEKSLEKALEFSLKDIFKTESRESIIKFLQLQQSI